ncbi:hypothetical protein [Lachnoclostridium phytofermentans]|uniref:hypothetical protein n=1 Tax=Lachnoclostridium phytofermentans TaxID=66219 RepID=UPI00049521A5|nr:hypothetical protein [Lachnoclostridium phytofermentans]
MMNNDKRINQLAMMYSNITNVPIQESKKVILGTKVGKAIRHNDMKTIYEQQTANLYEVFVETSSEGEINHKDLKDKIKQSLNVLSESEKNMKDSNIQFGVANVVLKNKSVSKLKRKQKEMLKEKQQNMVNVRRMEDAINIKR